MQVKDFIRYQQCVWNWTNIHAQKSLLGHYYSERNVLYYHLARPIYHF